MIRDASDLFYGWLAAFKPAERMTASTWAEQHIELPQGMTKQPGKLRLVAWQRQMVDLIADERTRIASIMLAAQCGKTTCQDVLTLWMMSQRPSPSMLVWPTEQMGSEYVRTRLDRIIKESAKLHGLIGGGRKGGGDSIRLKQFPGGYLMLGSANKPTDLAAKAIEYLALDEVDKFPASAGREGSPIDLAFRRTATFENTRKVIITSTPTTGTSRIAEWFREGSQHRFFVPCPCCGAFDYLKLENLKWTPGQPGDAKLRCSHCAEGLSDFDRLRALELGDWRATVDCEPGKISFHGTVLLSPFMSLPQIAADAEKHERQVDGKKTWANTFAAEPYTADDGEPLDAEALRERAEPVRAPYSADIVFITAGVDVQADRVEVTFLAQHARNNLATVLNHVKVMGDTSGHAVWEALALTLGTTFTLADKRTLRVELTGVDSGYNSTMVAEFCRAQQAKGRRVVAVKGASGFDKPIIRRGPNPLRNVTALFHVGVDGVKASVTARLRMTTFGPGFIHLPDHVDPSYFDGLAAEKLVTKHVRGFARQEWHMAVRSGGGGGNEPLDCITYASAVATLVKVQKVDSAAPPAEQPGAALARALNRGGQ